MTSLGSWPSGARATPTPFGLFRDGTISEEIVGKENI